tara:strand:+ start:444 stop:857 length:414 start_codon:yes stop_codon:yes gene_type:complete
MTEFDPSAILQYRPTEEEASGRSPLPPEGNYPNCELVDLQVFPPSDRYPKPGVLAVLKATFACPDYDGELVKRINFKKPLSRRSTLWKLMNAVWGDTMNDHTPEELSGIKVNIFITHEWTDGADSVKYADYKFTNVG